MEKSFSVSKKSFLVAKKYHIGYSNANGAIHCEQYVYWHDLGWTTAKTLLKAINQVLRRNHINMTAQESMDKGQVKVFEIVK